MDGFSNSSLQGALKVCLYSFFQNKPVLFFLNANDAKNSQHRLAWFYASTHVKSIDRLYSETERFYMHTFHAPKWDLVKKFCLQVTVGSLSSFGGHLVTPNTNLVSAIDSSPQKGRYEFFSETWCHILLQCIAEHFIDFAEKPQSNTKWGGGTMSEFGV